MRTSRKFLKRGFTLVETVVTVGIIGALAAVVYPTVVRQFDTADPTRAAEDLNNIRTGLETFGVNVRPQQPKDLEDLVNKPVAADFNALGVAYTLPTDASSWAGPYIGASIDAATTAATAVITTGFDATIRNELARFNTDSAGTIGGDSTTATNLVDADFLAVQIYGLSGTAFNTLNEMLDGPSESTVALRRGSGTLRCPYTGTAPANTDNCPVAYFLATPLRH